MPSYIYDMVDTWNAGATTFTAIKMNVTDTASAAGSLLMDLQVGGSSRFKVDKTGAITSTLASGTNAFSTNGRINADNGLIGGYDGALNGNLLLGSGVGIRWAASTSWAGTIDLILGRRAAASLRLGAADAAAPVAQTLGVQSVVAGTTNTAGVDFTIAGSQGTGTGAGGSIVFQVAPAGSSGTAQNALVSAMSINSNEAVTLRPSNTSGALLAAGDNGFRTLQFLGVNYGNNGVAAIRTDNFVAVRGSGGFAWESGANNPATGVLDVYLARDAADTLAQRRGANAQTFRVYNTTDGTNLERGYMRWSSNILQIGTEKAGTGSVRGIDFQTDGATNMRLGSDGSVSILDGSGGAQINFNVQASNGVRIASDRPLGFTSGFAANSSPDTTLRRVDAGIIGVRAGAITNGGALSFIEQTAPAAPAANGVYVYAEDDGAGKTRLMARFATGAAVQIAIEP